MMKKMILVGLLAVSLSSCFGTGQSKRYFDIRPLGVKSAGPRPYFDKVLFLDRVDVEDLYNDFRILYRLSATEINYYSYNFWAEKPDKLLRYALLRFMAERRVFRRVELKLGQEDPDWVLRAQVHCLEEVDESESWSARLAMDLVISEYKTNKVLSFWSFDRSLPLPRKDVTDLPKALSRILTEELEKYLRILREKGSGQGETRPGSEP
jgi:ABC-type uncharacterized transport system auxiliary subunit